MLRPIPVTFYTLAILVGAMTVGSAQTPAWQGEWITDRGILLVQQNENRVSGTYDQGNSLTGTVTGNRLVGTYSSGNSAGQIQLTLDADNMSFEGTWSLGNNSGKWRGWRRDPQAINSDNADFSGVWLSSLGTLQLTQHGHQVTGTYGSEGWGTIEGEVQGRHLKFTWRRIQWSGPAWLEMTADGSRLFGATESDDPVVWLGLRVRDFAHHAEPIAGEVVRGYADNGMMYYLRMPDEWQRGQEVDVIVLLHGSNWTTAGMVHVLANRWPSIGKRFAILGIQGQDWAPWSDADDLRFNYTYVNWMGRSMYQGYPFTDRESPFLVMQVIDELQNAYLFGRVFLGGHSQGGYLTYLLHMHFPEKLAGTFPIAGGVIMQAEPDVFADEELKAEQRSTPMVIVHGKQDQVVNFSVGQDAYGQFLAHGFPRVKLISPALGHPFDALPVGEAIEWLDVIAGDDVERLLAIAQRQVDQKAWRDVGIAIDRAIALRAGPEFSPIWEAYQQAANRDGERLLAAIRANRDGRWIDDYLQWQESFGASRIGAELQQAFDDLQQRHREPAQRLMDEALRAFRSGDSASGRAKCGEIVNTYYASPHYRRAKRWLTP